MNWKDKHTALLDDLEFEQKEHREMKELRDQYHNPGEERYEDYSRALRLIETKIDKLKQEIVRQRRGL